MRFEGGNVALLGVIAVGTVVAPVAGLAGKRMDRADARATARSYVQAIVGRDGATLCRLADPMTKAAVARLVAAERRDPSSSWKRVVKRLDCPHVVTLLIGYPHENMGLRFVGGRLITVGRSRPRRISSRLYQAVPVRVILRVERTGYATDYRGSLTPTINDIVWLVRTPSGWRTAKASLTLTVASNGDALTEPRLIRKTLSAPVR